MKNRNSQGYEDPLGYYRYEKLILEIVKYPAGNKKWRKTRYSRYVVAASDTEFSSDGR